MSTRHRQNLVRVALMCAKEEGLTRSFIAALADEVYGPLGNVPTCKIIYGTPVQDSDWRGGDSVRPEWLPLAKSPEYAEDGFEAVFYPMPGTEGEFHDAVTVNMHSFDYCGDYDTKATFVGVVISEMRWFGESCALEPYDKQREVVAAFLASVGLDRAPAVYALLSFG